MNVYCQRNLSQQGARAAAALCGAMIGLDLLLYDKVPRICDQSELAISVSLDSLFGSTCQN